MCVCINWMLFWLLRCLHRNDDGGFCIGLLEREREREVKTAGTDARLLIAKIQNEVTNV